MAKHRKYKIIKAMKNKNLINEEVVVENIPMRNVPPSDMPEWAKQLQQEMRDGFRKQEEYLKKLVKINNLKDPNDKN